MYPRERHSAGAVVATPYDQIVPKALAWEAEFLSALDDSQHRDLQQVLAKLERKLSDMDA